MAVFDELLIQISRFIRHNEVTEQLTTEVNITLLIYITGLRSICIKLTTKFDFYRSPGILIFNIILLVFN